jgi:hypothetical protein
MTSLERHKELHRVEAGEVLGNIDRTNVNGGLLRVCGLARGRTPTSSELNAKNIDTYVGRHSVSGTEKVALAVVHAPEDPSQAVLDIDPRIQEAARDVELLRGVVHVAMDESKVRVGLIDPELAGISEGVLEQVGFHAEEESGMYAIAG